MKTLVVGGYFGALLAHSGCDVTVVARGDHGRAIRAGGLRVLRAAGDLVVRVPTVERAEEARGVDLAIVAVKAFALLEVAAGVAAALAPAGVAVPVANGLGAEDLLAEIVGRERVMGATALIGAERIAPGVIRHDARGILVIGEAFAPGTGRAADVARFLEGGGVQVRRTDDLLAAKWWKMAWNCAFNPLTALLDCNVGEIMAHQALVDLARAASEEVLDLARGTGVALAADVADRLLAQNADLLHVSPSMRQDLRARRRTENEDLSGEIVRRARQAGRRAPVNETLYAMMKARETYGLRSGS